LGVVFKIDTLGTETILHNFGMGSDGAAPVAGPILDSVGNLYGTTPRAGSFGGGTIYRLTPSGSYSVLHNFRGGNDGSAPEGTLLRDSSGNLFGTTSAGGSHGSGVIFKVTPSGAEKILYSFTGGSDGSVPRGSLVSDALNNLYGTTTQGGNLNMGVVFEYSASGVFSVLHSFSNTGDGQYPSPDLTLDSSGRIYGAAQGKSNDGSLNNGVAFRLDPGGTVVALHYFSGTDGASPNDLLRGIYVDDYGTTKTGGDFNAGVIYKINSL
jgi:uncharacterized repeat protein (TIGR03803 family)